METLVVGTLGLLLHVWFCSVVCSFSMISWEEQNVSEITYFL